MCDILLTRDDCIETVLPRVEEAMESGEICRIRHIDDLGRLGIAALVLLTMANNLMDSTTGRVFRSRPGFCLMAIDDVGRSRILS